MSQLGSLELRKMSQMCAGRILVIFHPCLYIALKLTYPMNVGGIVLEGRIMSDIGTGSLGQSVRALIHADIQYVNKGIIFFNI